MPDVSVIVPNYNHSKYLGQRIDSILNQTFRDFEVILMDDCSDDNSVEILRSYSSHDKVSKVIINEINSGSTFKQWNKGIAEAKGRLIWIAESDDFAAPEFLEKLVPQFSNKKISLAFTQSVIVDENNQILNHLDEIDIKGDHHIFEGNDFIQRFLLTWNFIPNASAVVFRKEIFNRVGGPDFKFKLCADWHLWVKMLGQGDAYFLDSHLNHYRKHQNNVRSNTRYITFIHEHLMVLNFIKNKVGIGGNKLLPIVEKRLEECIQLLGQEKDKKGLLKMTFWVLILAGKIDLKAPARFVSMLSIKLGSKTLTKRRTSNQNIEVS